MPIPGAKTSPNAYAAALLNHSRYPPPPLPISCSPSLHVSEALARCEASSPPMSIASQCGTRHIGQSCLVQPREENMHEALALAEGDASGPSFFAVTGVGATL